MLNMLDEHLQMYWNVKRGLQVLRWIFSNIIQTYTTRLLCLGWTPLFTFRKMILGPLSNVSGCFLLPFQKYIFIISTFCNVSTQLTYLKKLTFYSLVHNILKRLLILNPLHHRWGLMTITTVGYDSSPKTLLGKVVHASHNNQNTIA